MYCYSEFWLRYAAGLVRLDPLFAARDTTPDWREDYLAAIADGAPLKDAVVLAGVSESTIFRWRRIDPSFAQAEADARLQTQPPMDAPALDDLDMSAWLKLSELARNDIVAGYAGRQPRVMTVSR